MTTDKRWPYKGGYIAEDTLLVYLDGAFNAEAQCNDDDRVGGVGGGGSNIGTFASSTRSGKEFHNKILILPPDSV